ncbi:hypothetical protein CI238_12267 [Colletotrichum incanum]|uniref:Uncharacterized protein n=1 Tax=Colletotrichum incanum TaxID=1573173 RepID=A0A167EBM9_COLIC|nr:hypothetical protein CI238_12267 [Colletotrichum incanum]
MLITNILITVATACAVMAPVALADDSRVRKSGKTDCSANEGPIRGYNRGVCNSLYSTDHGMRVIEHNTDCKIRGYPDGNCRGNVVTAFSTRKCHSLKGTWSFRVECP